MRTSLAARILKPACSMRVMICPATPLATASGLMMASVRWGVTVAGSARPAWTAGGLREMRGASLPEHLVDGGAHVGGAPDERGAGCFERRHLLRGRALAAGDDRARVPHAPAGRRRLAADERDDRLPHPVLDERRRVLLGRPADLADHHDRLGRGIVGEEAEHAHEAGPGDGVTADADAGGLADPPARELADDLVGQRPAPRDHADRPGPVDVARHDPDLRLARRDDAGAVRSDQPARLVREEVLDPDHVGDRDPLRDADDQGDPGGGGFHDGVSRSHRGHEDERAVGALVLHGLGHGVPDGEALVGPAALRRRGSADDGGAVLLAAGGVECPFATGDALNDDARGPADEDAHPTSFASATTFRAPSSMSSAVVSASPDSASIFLPSSTLVPSMRTPTGSRSQRRMPPNTLMNTARTLASEERIRNAFSICSGEAPPPTSRKFAGSPPASLMMSIVAIARPAPFTMQPTLPSSLM